MSRTRQQHLKAWSEFTQAVRGGASIKSRLHKTLTDNLPPYLNTIWRWFSDVNQYRPVTSQQVANALKLSQNHVSFSLKELTELGLLDRECLTEEIGQPFVYRYASWENETWRVE